VNPTQSHTVQVPSQAVWLWIPPSLILYRFHSFFAWARR